MIVYEPQPRWLPDIARLPVSYALRRAMYGTLVIGLYAAVLVGGLQLLGDVDVPHGAAAFSVLGGVTSLVLAFRVNNAYARWWEARLHWGLLVNHSRNLAALVDVLWTPSDRAGRRRIAGLVGDFAVGLSLHLRGELKAEHLESLTEAERETAAARAHPPSFVAQLVFREIEQRRADGPLDTAQVLEVQPHARAFLDVLGACERIRATPIPFAMTASIRFFLLVFSAFVPLGLHHEFGWGAVPITMLAFCVVAVMDSLAAELENPFGIECNDLPTRYIGEMIRRQVHELLEVERDGAPDQQPTRPRPYEKIR